MPEPASSTKPPVEVYEAVAARRLQFDNLVWQVPVLSLTAQAFLFTIALSAGNKQLARLIASGLAFIAALLSMQLMSRHRQAEIFDAHWLAAYEEDELQVDPPHGPQWAERRRRAPVHGRRWHEPFAKVGGYEAWMAGFALFALAAVGVFVVALIAPDAL